MAKGYPFFEVLTSAMKEDHRFPVLEIFAFVFTIGTFFAIATGGLYVPGLPSTVEESNIFHVVFSLTNLPVFVFVVVLMKNVAYGLGNDLDKGVLQTYLSYPLKRRTFLTAKLFSSIGVPFLLFFIIQVSALLIMIPDLVLKYIDTLLLSYAAILGYPIMLVSLVLLMTLLFERGSISLVVGIILYMASGIFSGLLMFMSQSEILLEIVTLVDPSNAMKRYYTGFGVPGMEDVWKLSFNDAILRLAGSYVLVILIFVVAYLYFERRVEV